MPESEEQALRTWFGTADVRFEQLDRLAGVDAAAEADPRPSP
jgi:hypothetical protein